MAGHEALFAQNCYFVNGHLSSRLFGLNLVLPFILPYVCISYTVSNTV